MKPLLSILFCLGLFTSFNFAQKQSPSKTYAVKKVKTKSQSRKKAKQTFACDLPARVDSLELNQTDISSVCPLGDDLCAADKIVKVRTAAIVSDEDKYVYSVSAGKIIGEGANVEWDLTDVKPGAYTITAGISKFGAGKFMEKPRRK